MKLWILFKSILFLNHLLKNDLFWGEFIKFVGEEYKVVKRRRECHGTREEYDVEKGKS